VIPERKHLTTAIRIGAVVLFPATLLACLIAFTAWLLCVAPAWLAYGIRVGRRRVEDLANAVDGGDDDGDGTEDVEKQAEVAPHIKCELVVHTRDIGGLAVGEKPRYGSGTRLYDLSDQIGFFSEQMRVVGWEQAKLVMRLERIDDK